MHYWFFSDWSRQTQTHPRSFRFSRFIRLRQAVVTVRCIVVWSELKVSSGASAKDQIACESKSRGQSDSTQEPPLATAQAMTWESTTKYCHTLLLDLLHSSPQHSTYNSSQKDTLVHRTMVGMLYESHLEAWHVLQSVDDRLVKQSSWADLYLIFSPWLS